MSAATTEYPTGPCPPKEQILNHIRNIFGEVGPHSLTMKILRLRLSSIYKIDFKEHTPLLSNWVQEVISEPSTNALLNESHKEANKKVGGTKKTSKSNSKRTREDREKDDKKAKKGEKKAKKHRDENEPKRPLSAYFMFANAVRPEVQERVKAENDGKIDVAKIGKAIGEMWAAATDADKVKYQQQADQDKIRYQTEMEKFLAEGGVKGGKSSSSKKGKKEKDPNAPKKPQTAYFAYMADVAPALREKCKEEHGKVDVAIVGKQVGVMWNSLAADQKAKYEKIAADDRLRWERECKERGITIKPSSAKAADGSSPSKGGNDDDSSSSDSDSSSSDDE